MTDASAMAKVIDALRPWHKKVVLVGGWAHRMHRIHPDAQIPSYSAVVTRDADVLFDSKVRMQGSIADALEQAGFVKKLSGDHVPPVSHFQLGDEDAGFYVEFLAPLRGSGVRRDGTDDATVSAAGVTAQKLRHMDVLLKAPWHMDLAPSFDLPLSASAQFMVANPVSFVVQKLLIQHLRRGKKKAQDLLYIHDTIELFSAKLLTLNRLWRAEVGPSLAAANRNEVLSRASELFGTVSDTIVEATRIPVDRRVDPGEFRVRCELGLAELFADSKG